MDDHLLQLPLSSGTLHYLLVDGVGSHETVDYDGTSLTNPVTAVLGLQVTLRVLFTDSD